MSNTLNLSQQKFIEKQLKSGVKSPSIAAALGISVWTVRKYKKRIKKGSC
jgi:DNA-binding CsgD family transcriptional regulator